jgi:predicted TIM-barrel fold metal-dependent hydrolase
MRVDVHQHPLTEPLIAALSARERPPRVRRGPDGGWVLELAGDPDHPIASRETDVEARAARVAEDGVDRALVCMSTVFGIESLPRAEAQPLLDAYADGVGALPEQFGHWASACVADPQPDELSARLDDPAAVGLALPAGALGGADELDYLAPLLDRLEELDAPLLVHPGPAPGFQASAPPPPRPTTPAWWPALTRYVYEMHAAWFAFVAFGRAQHPALRVVFVMLGGLAPLHLERLAARGGPAQDGIDGDVFFDTSSYGPQAIDAMVRALGVDQLVYGSDRPFAEPRRWTLGEAARHATLVTNPARLIGTAG